MLKHGADTLNHHFSYHPGTDYSDGGIIVAGKSVDIRAVIPERTAARRVKASVIAGIGKYDLRKSIFRDGNSVRRPCAEYLYSQL